MTIHPPVVVFMSQYTSAELNVPLLSLYTPDTVEIILRSQQLVMVRLWREHLLLNVLYCLMKLSQY